ncbi:MAG: branched-chain amino acid ABC transporter ATP-binding protein/permease [Chloroflexota bacterium]|nr:MAG: branched-chain amino acid ABC transporter ATP-binding protein/permease [Chloroflexota bacterium]
MNAQISTLSNTRLRVAVLVVLALVVVILPHVVNYYYAFETQVLALYIMAAVGLAIASGYTGLLSVGHAVFMTVGAYVAALLSVNMGMPMPLAALAAMFGAGLLSLLISLSAGRLGHLYFAVITLGVALLAEDFILQFPALGNYTGISGIARPDIFGLGRNGLYYLIIILAVLTVLAARNIVGSRWGRAFLLVRDHEVAATACGVSPYRTKVISFVLSAVPAGLAGALFAYLNQVVTPSSFSMNLALFLLLAVVVGGQGSILGAVAGVILMFAAPEYLREYRAYSDLIFAVILMGIIAVFPGGLAAAVFWLRRRGAAKPLASLQISQDSASLPTFVRPATAVGFGVSEVYKSFGRVKVLDGTTLEVPAGTVVAVIGPNGSGKTTLLNIVSGFYRLDSGRVTLDNQTLPQGRPDAIARHGVGRTFQTPKILKRVSVLQNVMAGYIYRGRSTVVEAAVMVGRARREEKEALARATALLDYFGLKARMHDPAGELAHPHLRFLELARALMANPSVVLLDEPAAGLTGEEVRMLHRVVRELAARGVAVVIVEHNIGLVLNVADRIAVLDSGRKIADGPPAVVRALPEVAEVYLGKEWSQTGSATAANVQGGGS